jgi:hypothetical protein
MPSPSKWLLRAGLLLLIISFTTMAIPVITQEFARSLTPANTDSPPKMAHNATFDIGFAISE